MVDETVTVTMTDDEAERTVTLPRGLMTMLSEGEQTPADVVGDLALFGCAQRVHGAIHHGEEEADPELEAIEAVTMELFEDRFGASYGEVTGHQH